MSAEGDFARRRGPGRVSIVGAGQVGTMLGMALVGAGPEGGVTEVTVFDRWANASHVRESVREVTRALSELVAATDDGPEHLAEVLAGARPTSERWA